MYGGSALAEAQAGIWGALAEAYIVYFKQLLRESATLDKSIRELTGRLLPTLQVLRAKIQIMKDRMNSPRTRKLNDLLVNSTKEFTEKGKLHADPLFYAAYWFWSRPYLPKENRDGKVFSADAARWAQENPTFRPMCTPDPTTHRTPIEEACLWDGRSFPPY